MLYSALAEPIGLEIEFPPEKRALALVRLGLARKKDPMLSNLIFRSTGSPGKIWIVHQPLAKLREEGL